MQYNYDSGGLKVDLAGAALKGQQFRALKDDRERAKAQELLKEQENKLMNSFIARQQADPTLNWQDSIERQQYAGIDPRQLIDYDNHFSNLSKEEKTDRRRIFGEAAYEGFLMYEQGDIAGLTDMLGQRIQVFKDAGIGEDQIEDTVDVYNALINGETEKAGDFLKRATAVAVTSGDITAANPMEYQRFKAITAPDGEQMVQRSNAYGSGFDSTGVKVRTEEQKEQAKSDRAIVEAQKKADIAVQEDLQKTLNKARSNEVAAVATRASEAASLANQQQPTIDQALALLNGGADTGILETIKFQVGRVLPNMANATQGQLLQAFTRLGFDELARFKGPTTNFELTYAQQIPGKFSDPTQANIARLNSLGRANTLLRNRSAFTNNLIKNSGDRNITATDIELAWNDEYNRKAWKFGDEKYSLRELQMMASKANNGLGSSMQDIFDLAEEIK